MNTPWPHALATQLLNWARRLEPTFGGAPAETLQRCVALLEAARAEGHVLIELGAVDAARLRASGLVDELGGDGFPRGLPLVLDGKQLYLHRDHEHEQALAARIAEMLRAPPKPIAAEPLRQLFPPGDGIDWQALAVAQALRQRLTVISGGPGTGKTSTVVRLLACVLAAEPEARIQLAAPTGKAAQRMLEALRAGLTQLPAAASLAAALPDQALTLHRLLGADGRGGYRHGRGQALQLDWLVVDEASMLDLALARQLFDAMPANGRLVLLGDRHQLAAVENGAVLAELSQQPCWREPSRLALQQALGLETLALPAPAGKAGDSALPDLALQFQRSHRFAADSGIGRLAACLRDGDGEAALALLHSGAADLRWQQGEGSAAWGAAVADGYAGYAAALRALLAEPGSGLLEDAVWRAWDGFRVLAAGHAGPLGSAAVNDWTANWLRGQLPATAPAGLGQALLVTRNQGELVNGDIALLLPDSGGGLKAQLRRGQEVLALAPERLPEQLAGAFALTVHKAQGSEFASALLLVPELEWTSREWLYTGATRAKAQLALIGSETALRGAMARPTLRRSGLRAAIQQLLQA